MTTILLGPNDKKIKSIELSKTLVRMLFSAHNLDTALVRFNSIYSGDVITADDMLGEFDAHVGDCGCQLRAQMLLSLTEYYHEPERREWISHAIQILGDIKKKILTMIFDIRRLKGDIRLLGFSSSISLVDVFERIGCKPLFTILDNCSPKIDEDDKFASSTTSDRDFISCSDNRGEEPFGIHSSTDHHHRIVKADKWNLSDYLMLARFLSYSRLLSLFKTASLKPGTTHIRYRLNPCLTFSEIEKQLDCLNLIDRDRLSNFIAPNERPSRRTLVSEIETMQVYITELTCDWMIRLSHEMGLRQPIQRLLEASIQVSTRGLYCIPAYSSILIIHFEWLVKCTPIFLVVRRFCTQGYHNTFYRVSVNPSVVHLNIEAVRQDNSKIVDLGSMDWFDLTPVPFNAVLTQGWAHRPHGILISNSIAGSMDDFYLRTSNDNQSKPHNESSPEHDEFIKSEFATTNFSEAVMRFFSVHDQYPFDLPNNENEWDVVEKIVGLNLGQEAATTYRRSVDETGSTALGLLNFQHIYTELPVVVIRQTEQIILHNEKPAPYGYRWAAVTS